MTGMNEKMELWRKAKEIVADALELAPAQRDALLAQRCGDDQALLREVQSLLTHARDDTSIIDTSAKLVSESLSSESAAQSAWIGQTLGAWRLEREIGHGGMGIVYLAQRADGAYRQSAAVKLLRGSASDARSVARMQRERQTLAQLTHPHIARLLDESKLERPWLKNAEEAMAGLPLSPPNTEAPISRPVGPAALPASAAAR